MKTLLSKDYAATRRKEIDLQKTGTYRAGAVPGATTSQEGRLHRRATMATRFT